MNEWETCISEWADRCNERDKEIASLQARLAACEKEALSVGAVSVAQLADWYVTVSNDCVELKKNLAVCEADIDYYQRAILVADDKRVQAEARVQALEQACQEHLKLIEQFTQRKLECLYCEDHEKLEQENVRLKEELAKHGAGKCCTMGKTYTRPEFHIDPDDY